ncbi:MAG: hypothetical protein M1831_007480 [Alyxoria varia]|nr:MAG: hypothetical protein M1831_007480 [Alyxoria varia]
MNGDSRATQQSGTEGAVSIPIIDLNSADAAAEVFQAACQHGFIFVKQESTGMSLDDAEHMFQLSKGFFSAPEQVKAECTINSSTSGKNHGWLSMHTETLDPAKQKKGDYKEAFNIGEYDIEGRAQQPLPSPLKPHEGAIGDFMHKCHQLCNQILRLIAIGLKIPDAAGGPYWFASRHNRLSGPSGSVLRLLYYPALADTMPFDPSEDIRAGAHSDYGSVTLLFRLPSQPGLEILTPSGDWDTVPVDPAPSAPSSRPPVLVNLGDLLSFWTNGLLKSTVHRVIFPKAGEGPKGGEDRYSVAYFCHPEDDAELVEIPSPSVDEHRSNLKNSTDSSIGNKTITARDHLNSRLAATYGI